MTIFDFVGLLTDETQEVKIYNLDNGFIEFEGKANEVPGQLIDCEVRSIDSLSEKTDVITLNIYV